MKVLAESVSAASGRAREVVREAMAAGRSARRAGLAACALEHFDAAAASDPLHEGAQLERAETLRQLDRAAEADALLATLIGRRPMSAAVQLALARAARSRGDLTAAVAALRIALAHAGSDGLQATVADMLASVGQSDAAAGAYAAVLARTPDHLKSLLGSATLARQAGHLQRAMALLRRAATAHPQSVQPPIALAALQRDLGEAAACRGTLQAVLARDAGVAAAWSQLGLLERGCGRHAEAAAAFEAAHRLQPQAIEPILQLAESYRTLGDQPRCDALFASAERCDPDRVATMRRRARQAAMAGDHAAALGLCAQALQSAPDATGLICAAADAEAKLGRTGAALARLDAAAARLGPDPVLVSKRLSLLRDAGDLPEALALCATLLDDIAAGRAQPAFELLGSMMRLLLLAGSDAQIADCVAAAANPATAHHRYVRASLHAQQAEEAGNLAAARAHLLDALEWRASEAATCMALTRVALLRFDLPEAQIYLQRNRALAAPTTRLLRRSSNASQTLLGQIIDEYRLDRDVRAAFTALEQQPAATRLEALMRLMAQHPDSTLLATAVVDTLARRGALDGIGTPDGAGIPRVIVQFWDAPEPPDDVAALMRSWADRNPGHAYRRFDVTAAERFLQANLAPPVLQAFRHARHAAQKADLFRLAYLSVAGGIYADADDRCIAPVDDALLVAGVDLLLYREMLGTLGNNFIAVVPRHPVLMRALTQAVAAVLRGDGDLLWFATGPGLITRAFAATLALGPAQAQIILRRTRVLTRRALHRTVVSHCRGAYKMTDLSWTNSEFAKLSGTAAASSAVTAGTGAAC